MKEHGAQSAAQYKHGASSSLTGLIYIRTEAALSLTEQHGRSGRGKRAGNVFGVGGIDRFLLHDALGRNNSAGDDSSHSPFYYSRPPTLVLWCNAHIKRKSGLHNIESQREINLGRLNVC